MGLSVCGSAPGLPPHSGKVSRRAAPERMGPLPGWRPNGPSGLAEYAQRQVEGDAPVRLVDDLADAQVPGQAAEDVSVLPAQPVVLGQPVDGVDRKSTR